MRNILIILFFLTTLKTVSQVLLEGKAHFNMSSNLNFKDLKNNEEVVLNKIFNFSKKDKSGLFVLEFNKNESLFYGEKRLKKNENILDLFEIKTRITGKIYVDYSNKTIIQEKNKYGETFDIKRKYLTDNWIITRDSMKIDGYNCFKAIYKQKKFKKNKTIAWFTPEIPLQIGPMGYGGLPGFILVLQEDIFTYSLSKLEFLSDLKIEKPDSGRLVSEKTYDSIYKEMKRKKEILEREREGFR